MNEVAYVGKTLLKSIAATANIFLLAQTLNMPLKNIERVIKYSPYTVFIFLFVYALSSVDAIIPALVGTVLYVIFEMDSLLDRPREGGDNNQKHYIKSALIPFGG